MLIMMADDMGYSDIGCFGGEIETPNIDALAARRRPVVAVLQHRALLPSRASLLTGLHPHQTGIGELVNDDGPGGYPGSLNDRCATLAETFAAAGYRTSLTGKWHLAASGSDRAAAGRPGADSSEFWGTSAGAGSYFAPTTLYDGEHAGRSRGAARGLLLHRRDRRAGGGRVAGRRGR